MAVGLVSAAAQVGAIIFGELMSGRALRPVTRAVVATDDDFDPQFDAEAADALDRPTENAVGASDTETVAQ